MIGGLKLLTFDRGKVILREGEPGNSLYMLTSGKVKAFVKKDGKQVPIAELEEGAFFGEMSILTGKPRTATISNTYCFSGAEEQFDVLRLRDGPERRLSSSRTIRLSIDLARSAEIFGKIRFKGQYRLGRLQLKMSGLIPTVTCRRYVPDAGVSWRRSAYRQ